MRLFDDLQKGSYGGFAFSAVRPEKLSSTEYTLASILMDVSGSVAGFEGQLMDVKKLALETCKSSPRADWLMFRSMLFNSSVDEEFGFLEALTIDENQLVAPSCGGGTKLRDAIWAAASATNEYARDLSAKEFSCNGLIFVVTDGDDTSSRRSVDEIKEELARGVKAEWLESLEVIVVGVNAAAYASSLTKFTNDLGIKPFVNAGDATKESLSRLANFLIRSVSSVSVSLGTGAPSQPVFF